MTVRLWTGGFRLWALTDWLAPVAMLLVTVSSSAPDTTFHVTPSLPSLWPGDEEFFAPLANQAFAQLSVGAALSGVALVLYGAMDVHADGDTFVQKWSNSRMTRLGLNILLVTGGAAGVIALARLWT